MKLPVSLLLDELRAQFSLPAYHLLGTPLLLERPLLYRREEPVEEGRLYLAASAAPFAQMSSACVLLPADCPPDMTVNCICVQAREDQLMNFLQRLWDRWEQWSAALDALVLSHGKPEALLTATQPLLGNPLSVVSADCSCVALSEPLSFLTQDNLFDLTARLMQDAHYRAILEAEAPVVLSSALLPCRSCNLNLWADGVATHRLSVWELHRPLRESDGWALRVLAGKLNYLLEEERRIDRSFTNLRSVIHRVLTDRSADPMEVSRQLCRMGWDDQDTYLCAVFQAKQVDALEHVCRLVTRTFSKCCALPFEQQAVCYIDLAQEAEETAALTDFARDHFLLAGHSRPMQGHAMLRRQYLQARAALVTGQRLFPQRPCHSFDSVALPYLLNQATRQLPAQMVCHPRLALLQAYDREHDADLWHTLRVYLDSSLNATTTAKALSIHRSTLLYRLARIRELLGAELEDPEELLYLSISVRLLDPA